MPQNPEKHPNMQQIAHAAGVSKSAVSLAMRNDPRIPAPTCERIQAIARDMGYRRNPVVDSLMVQLRAGRKPSFQANLGLINCSPLKDLTANHTFRRLREGVFRRAERMGYGIEEFWLQQPDLRPGRLRQILETRGIRGLILIASLTPEDLDSAYSELWYGFACAVIGVSPSGSRLNSATNDQYLTARRATQKALELGYRRPLLAVPERDDALLDNKFSAGFWSAGAGVKAADRLPVVHFDPADCGPAVARVRDSGADIVLTNKTELHDALLADGVSVPGDVSLVHLDWHDGIAHLAGMRQNNRVVGSAGVDLAVGQLQKNEVGAQEYPKVIQIESVWIDGPSVAATGKRKRAGTRKTAGSRKTAGTRKTAGSRKTAKRKTARS